MTWWGARRERRAERPGETFGPGGSGDPPPAGLPVLSRGRHHGPEQGSCVMEYVSVLAGTPFSAHPACTHPHLAWLARRVNDRLDESSRGRLAVLAPALIGTRRPHPAIPAAVYRAIARAGLTAAPDEHMLQDVAELAGRHVDWHTASGPNGRSWRRARPWQPLWTVDRHALLATAWAAADRLPHPEGDRLLLAALADAVTTTRDTLGLPPITTGLDSERGPRPASH
ncbi:hypothetical protein LQ327_28550 [Actinomycetospora endophytica]|uniref:Uncharacterized protein n=1 Tax=Actinomycetospora endophytica TaxID=2291215 RepID=A0ABS8PIL4_9PSEU|nr:hypothetical protein [Actinomycetospora endophytica]MCD2197330.1 hypothetical protein [Actinomycetospora endophytica]